MRTDFWKDWYVQQKIEGETINYQFFNLLYLYRRVFSSLFEKIYFNAHFRKKDPETKEKLGPNLKRVPVHFVTKNQIYTSFHEKKTVDGQPFMVPVIGISLGNISYDSKRQRNEISKSMDAEYINILRRFCSGAIFKSYLPQPFVQDYSVSILTDELTTQDQILSQILPQLTPTISFDINIPLYKKENCRVIYNGVDLANEFHREFDKERLLIITLTFSQEIMLFPPIRDDAIIHEIGLRINTIMQDEPEKWRDWEYDE